MKYGGDFFDNLILYLFICVGAVVAWPPDELRNLAIYILAYKGSGKSRLMGRVICWQDLLRGIPQVIIDSVGETINNILDSVLRLPAAQRKEVLPRIRYFDMSGKSGYVCPLPLYYRFAEESWNTVASRFVNAILMLDPNLANASIMGANAINRIGISTGMVVAASGWQLSEAQLLLEKPALFKKHLKALKAATADRGLRNACEFFISEYIGWDSKKKEQLAGSFLGKIDLLVRDNPTLAMFSASRPGFDLAQSIATGQTLLLDFRGDQQNPELLKFKTFWGLDYTANYIRHRGAGLSHKPLGLVIDEISLLSSFDATSSGKYDLFATMIDNLLNIWSRQGMIYITIANQEMFQISPQLFNSLKGCGTVVCGRTSDWGAATTLAQEFMPPQPHRVKRHEPIYQVDGTVRNYRQVDMSLEEQLSKAALLYKNLDKFKFLVKEVNKPAVWELDMSGVDPGAYPDKHRITEFRELLNCKCSTPIEAILAEIEARQAGLNEADKKPTKQARMKSGVQSAILGEDEQPTSGQPDNVPAADEGGSDEDDFWRKETTPENL